ncbi:hypothetical protein MycrhDRAFT_4120 [Mycolicibacterium rhodesiae JS60]|nr:hypothetical protein MycrhDRAFT_4120 [Mycolicibacterium rhodesiae JS60]
MSGVISGLGAPQVDETTETNPGTVDKPDDAPGAQLGDTDKPTDGDTFPRSYVEDLRKENADYRNRAKVAEDQADKLARRLHAALVTATNRLENAGDLAYDATHLDDEEQLKAALDALLVDRPYMAKRAVRGDAGQGNRGGADGGVNLLEMLKGVR